MQIVLSIAGSDSGGGAGIQADIKTITALGGFAATSITALTAQNTTGVQGILNTPPAFVTAQLQSVLSDLPVAAIKIGMLSNQAIIEAIAETLALPEYTKIPVILDTVCVAKGGAPLLEPSALSALRSHLIPRSLIITPNLPEAEMLLDTSITSLSGLHSGAEKLLTLGSRYVLLKGGHLDSDADVTDILASPDGVAEYTHPRIKTTSTHGTGCTLSSAIATFIAQGYPMPSAIQNATDFVHQAILEAPAIGTHHGPLAHINAWSRRYTPPDQR